MQSKNTNSTISKIIKKLLNQFQFLTNQCWQPTEDILIELESIVCKLGSSNLKSAKEREISFFANLNWKFRYNSKRLKTFIDTAAKQKIYFHYHDKQRIQNFFDKGDERGFNYWCDSKNWKRDVDRELRTLFRPLTHNESLELLADELREGNRYGDVMNALFGGFIFNSFKKEFLHKHFNNECSQENNYHPSYWNYLLNHYSDVLDRGTSLIGVKVDEKILNQFKDTDSFRDALFQLILDSYDILTNHCYLAFYIYPMEKHETALQWSLFSDLVLFAEKHSEIKLKKGYFHPEKIEKETSNYIPEICREKANFRLANEGFYYKDCFVLNNHRSGKDYHILVLFEKNERDETLIPCPTCRSKDVQGNSYPSLGVRSWECKNYFCPDKSKYNRGKRYSLTSLQKQQAIEDDDNLIPNKSLKRWKLDCLEGVNEKEALTMLIQHYTLVNDNVLLYNWNNAGSEISKRTITYRPEIHKSRISNLRDNFFDSAFFHRFRIKKKEEAIKSPFPNISTIPNIDLYCGDSYQVLQTFPDKSIDGVVTSPPYYNARSYSQWNNIYCYLYDIYNIGIQVHRVLKPGSLFIFNIFDYFDNENIMAFSAMGKKRMILGAYIVHLFEYIGFKVNGNIIWNKGEIEGKRNFNQGNLSPYYQTPFNCWEHIFVFAKSNINTKQNKSSEVLYLRPVVKIIRGENTHGHTAPYPEEIPKILLDIVDQKGTILDPFSGSMTTGRAAYKKGIHSINIEISSEYCQLGLNLAKAKDREISLFNA